MRPLPLAEGPTIPFWEAAREHRLVAQYCDACARYILPPVSSCRGCDRDGLPFRQLAGRATLNTYTVINDAPAEAFIPLLPYVVGVVELEEQPGLLMVTNIVGCAPERLEMGMRLEVTWDDLTAECTLPQFRPLET